LYRAGPPLEAAPFFFGKYARTSPSTPEISAGFSSA
jgi:hypothetical protein